VCVVGYNLVHEWEWWAPLSEEFAISTRQREYLEAGRKTADNGSKFWWRSMCSAAAVVASVRGDAPAQELSPELASSFLEQIARVQTVKCSPLGDRSRPSREMIRRCPPRFLIPELRVLRPGVLLCLGNRAWDAITDAFPVNETVHDAHFRRGTARIFDRHVHILRIPHPGGAWALWPKGQAEMVRSLVSEPVASLD
jgi:hypothetical protein